MEIVSPQEPQNGAAGAAALLMTDSKLPTTHFDAMKCLGIHPHNWRSKYKHPEGSSKFRWGSIPDGEGTPLSGDSRGTAAASLEQLHPRVNCMTGASDYVKKTLEWGRRPRSVT